MGKPTFNLSWGEIARRKDDGELVVVVDDKVYCIDDTFVHPGGFEVLANCNGTDATDLFDGTSPDGHAHSSAARSLLAAYYIGNLQATRETSTACRLPAAAKEEEQEHPAAATTAAAQLDETKPLLWQVGSLGDAYMEWVHTPVPGQPRFFESDWVEAVTKVQWWVVPLLWLPLAAHSLIRAAAYNINIGVIACLVVVGMIAWQLMEYSLHRFAFHQCPSTPVGIFLHFLLHGCHHKYPMDIDRLVFPPIPASWVVAVVYTGLHVILPPPAALSVFGGVMLGYVAYDCMHYFMHSGVLGGPLKVAHMRHHYSDPTAGYGISSPLFDWILGTSRK